MFFQKNSFPHQVVQKLFKKTLQNIYNPKPLCSTVERKPIFINLPYLGKDSFIIKKNVKLLISRFYPQVKPIFCFRTSFTIGSLFRVKDRIPLDLMSSVVYLYSCGQCTSSYVGQTSKQLKVRVSQHKGCSFRTNNPLTTPEKSNILHHSLTTNHPITIENFKILASCDKFDLRLLESLFIHKLKPSLNDQHSSTDLLIVNWYLIFFISFCLFNNSSTVIYDTV